MWLEKLFFSPLVVSSGWMCANLVFQTCVVAPQECMVLWTIGVVQRWLFKLCSLYPWKPWAVKWTWPLRNCRVIADHMCSCSTWIFPARISFFLTCNILHGLILPSQLCLTFWTPLFSVQCPSYLYQYILFEDNSSCRGLAFTLFTFEVICDINLFLLALFMGKVIIRLCAISLTRNMLW